jgi:Txe/YoeB family toxin of Txe-Axe toxin-antitoxin module
MQSTVGRIKKDMTKETIASLTKRGYSQKKIAKTLGIRKMKVVTYQKTHKIGKRAKGGAREFWSDVRSYQRMYGKSWRTATVQVKHTPYWGTKRLKKLDPKTMEYWKQKYEIERRLTGEQEKIWKEEERVYGSTPR